MRSNRSLACVIFAALAAASACAPASGPRDRGKAAGEGTRIAHLQAERSRDLAVLAAAEREAAAPTRPYDVAAYAIDGHFDWERKTLIATVTVRLSLTDPSAAAIELDSRVTRITAVTLGEAVHPSYDVDPARGLLTIDLTGLNAAARAGEIAVRIAYETAAEEPSDAASAFDASALRAIVGRPGDPVRARTLNTMSEPQSAAQWMPCNDRPSDRATFAVSLAMDAGETLIANGDLLSDRIDAAGRRVMSYATGYSLPTYLMAFAQGEFQVATARIGALPIGVVSRRGLRIDADGMLAELQRMIVRFQELVGPYPFDKYYIVQLPEFGGGEEHAGITFQGETYGPEPAIAGDRSMIAHELGHQWFGDYVTVRTWDDLWFKEGMATLLEAESQRPYEDAQGGGRLFGSSFDVAAGEAIVDRDLVPDDKYTSGPYGRAAWLYTQLRAHLGDAEFFATLRQLLRDNAYGSVGTDDVVAAFQPKIGAELTARMQRALVAKELPQLELARANGAGDAYDARVVDPDGALLLPLEVAAHTADGRTATAQVAADASGVTRLVAPAAGVLAFDARDAHPFWAFRLDDGAREALAEARAPRGGVTTKLLDRIGPQHQATLFAAAGDWLADAAAYEALAGALDSEIAKAHALAAACRRAEATGDAAVRAAWAGVLERRLAAPPLLGLTSWYATIDLGPCVRAVSRAPFAARLEAIRQAPHARGVSDGELTYLASLPLAPEEALATWSAVATAGPSPRARGVAARALSRYAKGAPGYARPGEPEMADWKRVFRELIATNFTSEVLRYTLDVPFALGDSEALPALATLVKGRAHTPTQRSAVCHAFRIAESDAAAWGAFRDGLAQAALPASVRSALADPEENCR